MFSVFSPLLEQYRRNFDIKKINSDLHTESIISVRISENLKSVGEMNDKGANYQA